MCLDIVPTFAGLIDFSALKKSILPRIKKICLSTSTLSVSIDQSPYKNHVFFVKNFAGDFLKLL